MGNVTYAVSERARRILKYLLILLVILLIIAPFFIFSEFGATKIHDWAVERKSPWLLYKSASIHRLMGGLSEERYGLAEKFFDEFIRRYPTHENVPYAYFYIAYSIEEQGRLDEAKRHYRDFIAAYPNHEKRAAADKALNRIEAFRPN